jgi:uncharacterized protein (DUF58 family)
MRLSSYIKPEVLAKISNLELKAKLVVEGFITGLHKSPFHGFSVEFSQHRPYNPGDTLRYIDWKVYGRTDRFYIKQFEEETNLKAYLLLDISKSMTYGSGTINKLTYAKYLAATLAYLMLLQRDAVGLGIFDHSMRRYLPPRSVISYLQPVIRELDGLTVGEDTNVGAVLHKLADQIKRRGLIILISDLLDTKEEILAGIRHFRYNGHEVLVFQILDSSERHFNFKGDVIFEDLETGESLRTQPSYIKKEYQSRMEQFIHELQASCLQDRVDYHLIETSDSLEDALISYLTKRSRLV